MYKYHTIAKDIENKIKNQEYQQGDKLPSIRQLMQIYKCSRWIAVKAYEELEKKHLVYAKKQSGYYVADGFLKTSDQQDIYSMHTGNPIVSATSLQDAKHCLSIAIDQYSSSLNISLEGVDSLREILPDFLSNMCIYTKKENIYLIQGITQMLSFFSTHTFFQSKKYILIEEPTYSYYVQFLKNMQIPTLTISRSSQGIDLKELERLFQNYPIKFFYITPRNHNPLGTTLDTKTRQAIARLALEYNIYIIEDDYFGHCSSTPRYLPLYYYMEGKNCIYLTSFSKTIPYIRIGICVIPSHFQEIFHEIIDTSYYYSYQLPSLISQATLESYIRSSLYQKQVTNLLQVLKKDYQIIRMHIKKWNQAIATLSTSYSGYYVTVYINFPIDLDKLEHVLLKYSLKVARNERCYYNKTKENTIRLSLARINSHDLDQALTILYREIQNMYLRGKE